MNLQQVKNAIFSTEYANLIKDGMCCSEPLPQKMPRGLVDCYFLYVRQDENVCSIPIGCFGIDSEHGEAVFAYPKEETVWKDRENIYVTCSIPEIEEMEKSYMKYTRLYPSVREFVYEKNCTEKQKQILSDYIQAFESYVGIEMMVFYREMVPDFFEWALSQCE